MNEQNKKVPTVRFKGFTNDWEQHKLGDVVNLIGGGPFKSTDSVSKGIPWLKIANVGVNGITWNTESYLPEYFWNDYPQYQLKKGNYVVALTRPILNHRLKISKLDRDALLNQRVAKLTTSENLQYIVHLLERKKVVLQIENNLSGSDPPNLSSKDLYRIKIKIPSESNEQKQIGTFLTKLDSIISLQQRKLDLLKQLKKGLLQKMFADKDSKRPVLQFKIFHDDWEQRKLGDLIKEFSIKSKIEDEYKVLSSTNSGMKFREGRVTGTSNLGYKIIKNGDLVLSPQNLWLGNININNIGKGLVSPSYKTFKLINIDSSFINPQLRTQKMLEEYKNSSTQGASVVRRNLEIDSFYQIKIFVPTISEQEKIGSFFQRLDNTIVLQHQKLAKCQSVKKSLLQQMFI